MDTVCPPANREPPHPTDGAIWQLIDTRSVGGIERHIATVTGSLRRHGLNASVVLFEDHGENPWLAQLAAARIPFAFLDGTLSGTIAALRKVRPSLLHTHGYKANIIGRLAARLTGTPVVSSFHSGEQPPFPLNAYYALDRWSSLLAPRIAVSGPIAARLPYGSELIPNYVAVPDILPTAPLPRRLAFVGRLSPEKAPEDFCALARFAPGDVECVVFGDGPMRAQLERSAGGRVRFAGLVGNMEAVWPQIGLLVMPSRYEGLPMAALEALAHGIPVLASRVGDLPNIVLPGETGWLFPSGDIDAARTGLEAWLSLSHDASQSMRVRCVDHVRKAYSEDALLPRIFEVYGRAGSVPALQVRDAS